MIQGSRLCSTSAGDVQSRCVDAIRLDCWMFSKAPSAPDVNVQTVSYTATTGFPGARSPDIVLDVWAVSPWHGDIGPVDGSHCMQLLLLLEHVARPVEDGFDLESDSLAKLL